MDMLNSIILEGNIVKAGVLDNYTGKLEFDICVERLYKSATGETLTDKPVFSVYAVGKLAEFASDRRRVHEGRGIRVVGRLAIDDGKVKVFAEHIEFKAEYKPGNEEA